MPDDAACDVLKLREAPLPRQRFAPLVAGLVLAWCAGTDAAVLTPDDPVGVSELERLHPQSSKAAPAPAPYPGRIVFFPPTTPAFGRPIANTAPRRVFNGRSFDAPDELADDVNEFFYPALGTRLIENKLDDPLATRLATYHQTRTALLNELLNALTLAPTGDPAARERALRDFARTQTPRILAFEADAERLGEDLIHGGLLGYNAEWSQDREWRLGDALPSLGPFGSTAEFQVIRATAHYQKGLLPEQRGLLREIALEQQESLRAARSPAAAASRNPLEIYFSPETTRLLLPAGLPPALSAKIGAYDGDKAALKRELRDTVVAQDKSSNGKRLRAFQDLADLQRPRLAALADLAEEIRRGLGTLPDPPPPPLPPHVSPDLAARIEAYKRDKGALEKERFARFAHFQSLVAPPLPLQLEAGESTESRRDKIWAALNARLEAQRKIDQEFLQENVARYQALAEQLKSIKDELTVIAQAQIDPATGQPMDVKTLMGRINAVDRHFDELGREEVIYKDYRTAMLEPGLSPPQRRLLFGAALVGLAQPLPPGEPMPSGRFPHPGL